MRAIRVLVSDAPVEPGRMRLDREQAHHLGKVLRLKPGHAIEVVDGRGGLFRALWLGGRAGEIEVTESCGIEPPWPAERLTVALGIVKGARMDWAVEKLSELGVGCLQPLLARRAAARPSPERWRRVAVAAARQCGRARLLEILEPCAVEALAGRYAGVAGRVLWPGAPTASSCGRPELLVIGPEGGLTEDERLCLREAGFVEIGLETPVLRSETAAVAAALLAIGA